MKNQTIILLLSIILFASCSKEDDILIDPITESKTLCTKRTVDYSDDYNVNTKIYEYNYDGTQLIDWKLTSIFDNETRVTTYTNTYTNDLISSMIIDNGDNTDYYDFEYDSQGRVTKSFKNNLLDYTHDYVGLKVISKKIQQDTLIIEQTYDSNYNLVLNKKKLSSDSTWVGGTVEFTHDNKNMPFVNVDQWYPTSPFRYLSSNNTTKIISNVSVTSMDISYRSDNFPIGIFTTNSDGSFKSETLEYNN